MSDNERDKMKAAQEHMQRALETASHLPPLFGVKDRRECETCGHTTYVVARYDDGRERAVCLDCAVKEMDAFEAQQKEQG